MVAIRRVGFFQELSLNGKCSATGNMLNVGKAIAIGTVIPGSVPACL